MNNNCLDSINTFWNLIDNHKVRIPKLQRDYAQGRENDPKIAQIRQSLVDELYYAVTDNKPLVLNFIYGSVNDSNDSSIFEPVDGQQRLTTLFLLHWYVFGRSGNQEGMEKLKDFSYETRHSSERFCKNICECVIDFSQDSVAEQIKECYWFTGALMSDPTIQSMLVMIDEIHMRFGDIDDFEKINRSLIYDCPISFLWLQMHGFTRTDDLYIKMNSRGKLLSDFEIFKAKLQNSEYLTQLLGDDATDNDKVVFISKYNNQHAEFFYKLFEEDYDAALMNFVKENLRDSYFSYVSKSKVNQKTYRGDYSKLRFMNGSVLFNYIENGGEGSKYEQCKEPETAFLDGLKRVDKLLDSFESMQQPLVFKNTHSKVYFDELEYFKSSLYKESLEDDVIRYSTYSFIYRFDIPASEDEESAYSMWKRFIKNLVTNTDFGGRREDICEAFVYIEDLISSIESYDEYGVLKVIANAESTSCPSAIKPQIIEEKLKARLMNDSLWKAEILAAENYFEDGQIKFLLQYSSKQGDNYDLYLFKSYFSQISSVLDSKKRLREDISASRFEQALLCMPDETDNHTGHLIKQANSQASWGFVGNNYKLLLSNTSAANKKQIFRCLIDRLIGATDIKRELDSIIESTDFSGFASDSNWKIPFIKQDLFGIEMGGYLFKNCINLYDNNSEILLMSGTTVRSKSMELNTFLLYKELIDMGIDASLTLYATWDMYDKYGFPLRYIEAKDFKIGYMGRDENKPFVYQIGDGNTVIASREDILKLFEMDM